VKEVRALAPSNNDSASVARTAAQVAASARRTGASGGHGTIVGSMSVASAAGSIDDAWTR
jgi:hypothetical protein